MMIKRYLFRQNGLTLIEILATIAISSMILGILTTALVTTYKHRDITENHINLRQEANIIITQLRSNHQDEASNNIKTYPFCFPNSNIIEELVITISNKEKVPLTIGDCVQVSPFSDIPIEFKLSDEDQEFRVDTVIRGYSLASVESNSPDDPDNPNENDFYSYLRNNNVFVQGSQFSFSGNPKLMDLKQLCLLTEV